MGTKETIGHIDCPVCGFEAPVKEDRNGHAYAHCAHSCQAQVFTRNAHRDSLLRRRMRPVTVTVTVTEEKTEPPAPVQAPAQPLQIPTFAPSPPPAKATKPAPAAPAEQAPPKQKANWFNTVLGAANGPA